MSEPKGVITKSYKMRFEGIISSDLNELGPALGELAWRLNAMRKRGQVASEVKLAFDLDWDPQ